MNAVLAAFVGALVGSLGAVVAKDWFDRRRAQRERSDALVRLYVFQLQDAAEALWHRLYNIGYEQGTSAMGPEYLERTTVFALGRLLAAERALGLGGVYPELARLYPRLSEALEERLAVSLRVPGLQQYDRLALAEAALERDAEGFRPSTYLGFVDRYAAGPGEAQWLVAARAAVRGLAHQGAIDPLLDSLTPVVQEAAEVTGLKSSTEEKQAELASRRAAR